MLRPRAPQQLGYSFSEFTNDVWGGAKSTVTTPFKLAKDVLTLDPCGFIRDTIPIEKARELVSKVGCNPVGSAAATAGIIALTKNPAVATIGSSVLQTCLCNWVQQHAVPNQFPPGFFQQQPLPQQYAVAAEPIYKKPIFWIGISAAVAGLILATSKKSKSSSAPAAAPATAPVVVNVKTSKDEEE